MRISSFSCHSLARFGAQDFGVVGLFQTSADYGGVYVHRSFWQYLAYVLADGLADG